MPVLPNTSSRAFDFRLALGIPAALATILLSAYPASLDFSLAYASYTPGIGFVGQHSYWLETVLHEHGRQAVALLVVLALAAFVASFFRAALKPWRRQLGYAVLAIVLSTGLVAPLKAATAVHCPWSLSEFGGDETYTPLLSPRAPTSNPGRCWPGGHASSGFSLFALYFALRDRRPRAARIALGVALGLGTLFSVGRMLQGAHFLSHNLWTMLIDWTVCVLCYRWLLYRAPDSGPVATPAPTRAVPT